MQERLRTIYYEWQQIAERLRRRGALFSLAALLSLGLFEPLGCILHCEMIGLLSGSANTPAFTHHHTQASHEQHAHHMSDAPAAHTEDSTACRQFYGCEAMTTAHCQPVAPQPFHEMSLLFIILLVPLGLIARRRRPLTAPPRQFYIPPLRRPPILCV